MVRLKKGKIESKRESRESDPRRSHGQIRSRFEGPGRARPDALGGTSRFTDFGGARKPGQKFPGNLYVLRSASLCVPAVKILFYVYFSGRHPGIQGVLEVSAVKLISEGTQDYGLGLICSARLSS